MTGWTLDDALTTGQGIERPFRCPEHDDTTASASVNVLKRVWFCYACKAAGSVDGKKAPTAAQLSAMLEPEKSCRVYPESWLDLFRLDPDSYWLTRFPEWLCWRLGLGEDPFTGDSTFPVRTPDGSLAGVGRRLLDPAEDEPRYKYPARWSASRTLGGYDRQDGADSVGVLVEGRADEAALREIGMDAFACFGAGMHAPQKELVMRAGKKIWLLGFDMDEAGDRAAERAEADLAPLVTVARVSWVKKDPAECTVQQRLDSVLDALVNKARQAGKTAASSIVEHWNAKVEGMQTGYTMWLQEVA